MPLDVYHVLLLILIVELQSLVQLELTLYHVVGNVLPELGQMEVSNLHQLSIKFKYISSNIIFDKSIRVAAVQAFGQLLVLQKHVDKQHILVHFVIVIMLTAVIPPR